MASDYVVRNRHLRNSVHAKPGRIAINLPPLHEIKRNGQSRKRLASQLDTSYDTEMTMSQNGAAHLDVEVDGAGLETPPEGFGDHDVSSEVLENVIPDASVEQPLESLRLKSYDAIELPATNLREKSHIASEYALPEFITKPLTSESATGNHQTRNESPINLRRCQSKGRRGLTPRHSGGTDAVITKERSRPKSMRISNPKECPGVSSIYTGDRLTFEDDGETIYTGQKIWPNARKSGKEGQFQACVSSTASDSIIPRPSVLALLHATTTPTAMTLGGDVECFSPRSVSHESTMPARCILRPFPHHILKSTD